MTDQLRVKALALLAALDLLPRYPSEDVAAASTALAAALQAKAPGPDQVVVVYTLTPVQAAHHRALADLARVLTQLRAALPHVGLADSGEEAVYALERKVVQAEHLFWGEVHREVRVPG